MRGVDGSYRHSLTKNLKRGPKIQGRNIGVSFFNDEDGAGICDPFLE